MGGVYQYETLPESGYIRVMTLHPAPELDDPLRCDLEIAPLDRDSYTTLSYSWGMNANGDVALNRSITISNNALAITQNLFEGLRRIRDKAKSKRIWIDAICINQSDVAERSAQVAQMADIYSGATHTIIWLGEGKSESEDKAIADLACCNPENYGSGIDPQATMRHSDGQLFKLSEAFQAIYALRTIYLYEDTKPQLSAILGRYGPDIVREMHTVISTACLLFTRRYWQRRWVVQELFYSAHKANEIRWGPCTFLRLERLLSSSLGWVLDHLLYAPLYEMELVDFGIIAKGQLEHILRARSTHPSPYMTVGSGLEQRLDTVYYVGDMLLDTLKTYSFTECADDRDRLYAFLGMYPGYPIRRNYSISASEAFSTFAIILVQRKQLVKILMCLASENLEKGVTRLPGLPSWVPDLRSKTLQFYNPFGPEVGAVVSPSRNLITCNVQCMGSVIRPEDDLDDPHVIPTPLRALHPTGHPLEYRLVGLNNNLQRPRHNDLICSLELESSNDLSPVEGVCVLILREDYALLNGQTVYQLITCGRQPYMEPDKDWPRISVCIG